MCGRLWFARRLGRANDGDEALERVPLVTEIEKQTEGTSDAKITLSGAVSMGTGVMIGAGVFALMGQVAGTAGKWFPLAFLAAAVVAAITSYSYVKLSNTFPSAGGIGTFLNKAYGVGPIATTFTIRSERDRRPSNGAQHRACAGHRRGRPERQIGALQLEAAVDPDRDHRTDNADEYPHH